MGNACGKNAANQVKTSKADAPAFDTSALDERERQNEALRQQKRDLEAELARWRQQQAERMQQVESELSAAQEESAKILTAGGDSAELKVAAERIFKDEQSTADADDAALLTARKNALSQYLTTMTEENAALAELSKQTEAGARDLDDLLENSGLNLGNGGAGSRNESEASRQARHLGLIAELYRPVSRPTTIRECIDQSCVDCAECSSQTVRNLKALVHQCRTGDTSWYKSRPIRGILCNTLRLGNKPHDPWDCEICNYLDNSDVPLFV